MSDKITYEHPLNERVRLLLRLAHLLDQFSVYYPRADAWDSRCAVSVLVDISSILSRSDIKAEVIKELERHLSRLAQIRATPGIDAQRLGSIMDSLESAMSNMRIASPGPLGAGLRENEFLKAVTQRSSIPGGTLRLASRTSPAFSPKMARRSFSSGVSWVSPLGVTLPTRIEPWRTWAPMWMIPASSRWASCCCQT